MNPDRLDLAVHGPDMISGKLDPMKAFTSGKLKIDGDVMKSQLIGKLFKL